MPLRPLPAIALIAALATAAVAQDFAYRDNAALAQELQRIAAAAPGHAELSELAKSPNGEPVWLMRLGTKTENAPALLVVAGLDGRTVHTTEAALATIEAAAATDSELRKALESRTLYVVPRLNPEGAAAFFRKPRVEIAGTNASWDEDGDGTAGDDRADDLNGDGMVSQMRIEHPRGTLVPDGAGGVLLRPAKTEKGERGRYLLQGEGLDNDRDGAIDEEHDSGIHLAQQFPAKFRQHRRGSRAGTMAAPEARALADLLIRTPQIGAVVVFGPEDNLLNTPPREQASDPDIERRWGRKPVETWNVRDLPILAEIGRRYRKDLNLEGEVNTPDNDDHARGSFASFAYYARGRFAVATPVWTPRLQMAWLEKNPPKRPDNAPPIPEDMDDSLKGEQRFHDWMRATVPGAWLGWNAVTHPDYPGKTVEVGGWAPFSRIVPPPALASELLTTQTLLVTTMAQSLPRIELAEATLKPLGGGVHELKLTVRNGGLLPDVLRQGQFSNHVRRTRIEFPEESVAVLGAPRTILLDPIAGAGGVREVRRTLRLPKNAETLRVRIVSELGGTIDATVPVGR